MVDCSKLVFFHIFTDIKDEKQLRMYIPARTVSYRLQKIVKLTGMNFDNIAEMLAVRNGIIILKILEQL